MNDRFVFIVMAALAVMALLFPDCDSSIKVVVDPVLIGGIASGLGSLFNGVFGSSSQASANRTNLQIARETNDANMRIHQADNEFNRQMAFDMFNAENAYNSPAAQKARLEQAGLNPASMVENGYNAVSSDGSTPQAASPIPMIAPQVQPVPSPLKSFFGDIGTAAQAFAQLNQGNLSGAQKKLVLTQAQTEEYRKRMAAVDASIKQAYGIPNASAAYQKSLKELQELDGKINNLALQGDVFEAEKFLKKAQAIKFETDNDLERATFNSIVQQEVEKVNNLRKTGELIDETKNTEKSKQSANYASANASNAQAAESNARTITENEFRELRKTSLRLANGIDALEFKENAEVYRKKVDALINEYKNRGLISDRQLELLQEDVERAKKANDWYHWDKVFDKIERINDGVNKWAPWALSRDGSPSPQEGMFYQSWQSNSTR